MTTSISGAYHKELDFVLKQLTACKGTWRTVSNDSGIPYDTLTKIALRRVKTPRTPTVETLATFFRGKEK